MIVEFEIISKIKPEIMISGFVDTEEINGDEPLNFYDRQGFEAGHQIPENISKEGTLHYKEYEKISSAVQSDDMLLKYIYDFREENICIERADYLLKINDGFVDKKSSIQIHESTKEIIKDIAKKGESYEEVLLKYLPIRCCLTATTDSYTTHYSLYTIDEIISFIKRQREKSGKYNYNIYDTEHSIIKCSRPGYEYHDCIKLQFRSPAQAEEFEKRTKHLF